MEPPGFLTQQLRVDHSGELEMGKFTLLNKRPCIIVASIGRSGSTLTTKTLTAAAQTIWRDRPSEFAASLSKAKLARGTICKTHDYPAALTGRTGKAKALFIFGSTIDSVISVHSCIDRKGPEWIDRHLKHLQSDGHIDDLFNYDVLMLGPQIKTWATFDGIPTLCVRYDKLWDHAAEIAAFTGYDFDLPAFEQRTPKTLDDGLMAKARQLYEPLDDIVMKLPTIFTAGSHMAPQVAGL